MFKPAAEAWGVGPVLVICALISLGGKIRNMPITIRFFLPVIVVVVVVVDDNDSHILLTAKVNATVTNQAHILNNIALK